MKINNTHFKLPNSKRAAVLASSLILLISSVSVIAAQPKHLAVAPDEMHSQRLPKPESKGLLSHSTMLPLYENRSYQVGKTSSATQVITQSFYSDGLQNSPIIFLSPNAEKWNMTVTSPSGRQLVSESSRADSKLSIQSIPMGEQSFKGKSLTITNPESGKWQIRLTSNRSPIGRLNRPIQSKMADYRNSLNLVKQESKPLEKPIGFLLFKGDRNYKLYSYLDNNFTLQNSNINIVAKMVDNTGSNKSRAYLASKKPMNSAISRAYARITSPSKKILRIALNDRGINGDKLAGDGLFSARIPSKEVGTYTSQVQVEGIRPDGLKFSRTATDIYPIEKASFRFSGQPAQLRIRTNTESSISVPVRQLTSKNKIFMSAEIWGTNAKGEKQSASWIGGVVTSPTTKANTQTMLTLDFDTRWLTRNQLKAPFTLKSLRLQSIDKNVPIAQQDQLPLRLKHHHFMTRFGAKSIAKNTSLNLLNKASSKKISREMLMGKAPKTSQLSNKAAAGGKLLLVHGYCSGSVWSTSSFTNSAEFKDYNQNRSHEAFAQKIMDFGAPYSSYGIVAHSQGGAAALHIYTRYWSGLDHATGGRIIQSVGTPYQGTALAGNLAVLGQIFGAGCGVNTDMTYSGAANWLATIPSWARSQVDYYTTSFTDKWWRYDYCHLATDLFLDDPEDGTTEKWAGQLSGGVNMGHKTGWCHTRGMRDTAQYLDSSRNASMNSRAAR